VQRILVQFPANVSLIDVMVLAQFQAVRTRERNITALEEIERVLCLNPNRKVAASYRPVFKKKQLNDTRLQEFM
jgi:hypothetical protein